MKKSLILAALIAIATTASYAKFDGDKKFDRGDKFMENLTEAQRECVKDQNCPKPDFKKGEKMDKEAAKESRECMKKAFEACGLEMPEKPKGEGKGKKNK